MNTAIKAMIAALAGLLAFTAVAAAQTVEECPECDEDVPPNGDCTYSSYDTGYITNHSVDLIDTDACVHEADEHGGFWAVVSVCLTQILEVAGEWTGVFASFDLFVSEDGMDLDGGVATTDGEVLDFDDSPVGGLDDETWGHMDELGVEAPETEVLPEEGVIVNECVYETELMPCG